MNGFPVCSQLQPFGARIDFDLRHKASVRQVEHFRRLFDTHHLLYFPDQSLSPEVQGRVCEWFGPISKDKGVTYFATDTNMGKLGSGELAFHSDLSCTPAPLIGLSLHALSVTERSSPTQFIDAMAAARNLPADLRARLQALHVVNLWPIDVSVRQRQSAAPKDWPGAEHPLLMAHPRTEQPILYVNASHSDRIAELSAQESESLIEELFRWLYDPANRYDHHWRNGDFVVWDNLALQHARAAVPPDVPRTLQRVEIGSTSARDLMPPELLSAYLHS